MTVYVDTSLVSRPPNQMFQFFSLQFLAALLSTINR